MLPTRSPAIHEYANAACVHYVSRQVIASINRNTTRLSLRV